jgi:CubicO group peptidase (beta-lactamase class C family)
VFGVLLQRKLAAANIDMNPLEYLETRIFNRIGVEYASWFHDESGNPHIPNGAHITPRNWVRFGQFMLQQGWWNGKQVIQESHMASLRIATGPNPGHGAFLWLNTPNGYPPFPEPTPPGATAGFIYPKGHPEMIAAMGAGKNRMYIVPGRDAVIARQTFGDTTDFSDEEFLDFLLSSDD